MTVTLLIAGIFVKKAIYVLHSLSTLTSKRRGSSCKGCSHTGDGAGKFSGKVPSLGVERRKQLKLKHRKLRIA